MAAAKRSGLGCPAALNTGVSMAKGHEVGFYLPFADLLSMTNWGGGFLSGASRRFS